MTRHVRLDALDEIERTMANLFRSARGRAVNVSEELIEPYDGKPALRPHTIPGWWQVWSGSTCVALLKPEDVAPVTEELRGRLRNAEDALRERVGSRPTTPTGSEGPR